jgi:hypothetical protein
MAASGVVDYSNGADPALNQFAQLPNFAAGQGVVGAMPVPGMSPLSAPMSGSSPASSPWTPSGGTNTSLPAGSPPFVEGQPVPSQYLTGSASTTTGTSGGLQNGPPTGGSITDPTYAAQLVAYYAKQPGADPSLTNDPNYWIDKMTSGAFGTDQNYAVQKMQTAWLQPASAAGGASGGGAAGGSGYVVGQGVPGQGTVFGASNPLTGTSNALLTQLMSRANESLVVDPNDPVIKAQTEAFDAQQTNAGKNTLSQIAEAGGPSTNMTAQTRSVGEQEGQADATFRATLMANEVAARRTEIQNALQGAYGLLTAEQQAELQEELSQLGLAQGAYQFDTNQTYLNSPLAPGAVG